jgi:hypothetical protein
MMSFLTYITGFFMNFELLPILTDYEIKKKSSPLKLLSQFQPNFAEMILRWSPFPLFSNLHNRSKSVKVQSSLKIP